MTSGLAMVGMWIPLLLGIMLMALLAWTPARMLRREARPVAVRHVRTEHTLRERLARGKISAREFEDRMRRSWGS
jgi:uncharacterized membrane protein